MKSRLLLLLMRFFAVLPLPVARALGKVMGQVCWITRRRMAQTTLINLKLCFPQLNVVDRNRLAGRSLSHTFQTISETGAVWLWPAADALRLVREVEGMEVLAAAHAAGKGVLVLSPHVGNWEILGLYLNTCGCGPSSQLYLAPDDPALAAVIHHARSRSGARMVATDKKGVSELLQALRRGELVGILPDQVPPETGGEYAPFYGVPALTMTLVNRLQQKTGAVVVTACARRIKGGFRIIFTAPDPAIYAGSMPDALTGLNRSMERVINGTPEQYQWGYKRFKRQPPGSPAVY